MTNKASKKNLLKYKNINLEDFNNIIKERWKIYIKYLENKKRI